MRIKNFLEDGIHAQIKVIKGSFHNNLGNLKGIIFKRYFYEEAVVTCEKMRRYLVTSEEFVPPTRYL